MDYKLIFKCALLTGEIMLRNGAEMHRVEDTILRILKTTKFEVTECFATPTGIFVTLDDPSIDMVTTIKRVHHRTNHLHKVQMANNISREYVNGNISAPLAYQKLVKVTKEPPYGPALTIIAYCFTAAFFAPVFGGDFNDFIVSAIIGLAVGFVIVFLEKRNVSIFIIDIIGGMIVGLIAIIFCQVISFGHNFDTIIISSIMPLVPGLAITNAVRDTFQGHLVSGISRAVEAFFIAVCIASGVGIILDFYFSYIGGL